MGKKLSCSFSYALLGLLLLVIPASGNAHSGGLDSIGCHHDRKKGGYHCHRGPLAGQSFSTKEEALQVLEKQKKEPAEGDKKDQPDGQSDSRQSSGTKYPAVH